LVARVKLCQEQGIPNTNLSGKDISDRVLEGIKKIRLSDTNKYEGEREGDDFSPDRSF